MEINLKDTLRALRQKKNVTQEALAAYLGITQQSVGKWERGEGFPDITLLPRIALYFDVTVDELLDVGRARIEDRIQAYLDESMRYKNIGENEKNLALWERAYDEFPNDCRVMDGLMNAINREANYPCPKEDAERIISLGERILQTSTDVELRENAIQTLCYTYHFMDDEENALRYANMGGSIHVTRQDLRATVQKGEAGVKACQAYIASLISHASIQAGWMVQKGEFSPEEKVAVYQFCVDLHKLLLSDGNVGFYAYDFSQDYFFIAGCYAGMKDAERTIEALEQCAEYAAITADLDGELQYTAPMVNRLKYDPTETSKNFKGNACNLRLQGLEWSGFDFVREDERFRRIVEQLKQHAE